MTLRSFIKSWGQLDPCPLYLILSLLSAVHLLLDSLTQGLLFCLSPLHLLWLHLSFPTQFSILKEQRAYKHPMAEWVQRDDVSSLAGFPVTVTRTPLGPVCVCRTSCAAFSSHYHTQREKENKLGPNVAGVDFWVGLIACVAEIRPLLAPITISCSLEWAFEGSHPPCSHCDIEQGFAAFQKLE